MFTPVSISGKFFKKYLSMNSHPAKIRIQNIIGKKFFSAGIILQNENEVSFKLSANDWITRTMILHGDYEPNSTMLAKNILKNGGVLLDIGANFGLFTCIAARHNEKVKVFAVEPNYKIIQRLLDNINRNNLQNRVQVINTALSEKIQSVSLEQPYSDNLGTTVTKPDTSSILCILSCPLEFIFSEYKIDTAVLLKIDIEGNEFEVLKNFPFEKYKINNILIEFNHLSKRSFEEMNSFFISKNFKSYTISGIELRTDNQPIPENNIWFVNQHLIKLQ